MCIFSSFGGPTSGALSSSYPEGSPSVLFGPAQRISLTATTEIGGPDFGLFYLREEYDDVVTRLCSNPTFQYSLSPEAIDEVFELTTGHPATVSAILCYVDSPVAVGSKA